MKKIMFAIVLTAMGAPAMADPCPGIRDLAWVSMYLRQNNFTIEEAMDRMVTRFETLGAVGTEPEWRVFFYQIGADAWQSAVYNSPRRQKAAADKYASTANKLCQTALQSKPLL